MEGRGGGSYKQLTCPQLSDGEFPCRAARFGLEAETCLLLGLPVHLLLEGLKGMLPSLEEEDFRSTASHGALL